MLVLTIGFWICIALFVLALIGLPAIVNQGYILNDAGTMGFSIVLELSVLAVAIGLFAVHAYSSPYWLAVCALVGVIAMAFKSFTSSVRHVGTTQDVSTLDGQLTMYIVLAKATALIILFV